MSRAKPIVLGDPYIIELQTGDLNVGDTYTLKLTIENDKQKVFAQQRSIKIVAPLTDRIENE